MTKPASGSSGISQIQLAAVFANGCVAADAASWIERYRAFWSRQLDALGDYLEKEDNRCNPPSKADRPE